MRRGGGCFQGRQASGGGRGRGAAALRTSKQPTTHDANLMTQLPSLQRTLPHLDACFQPPGAAAHCEGLHTSAHGAQLINRCSNPAASHPQTPTLSRRASNQCCRSCSSLRRPLRLNSRCTINRLLPPSPHSTLSTHASNQCRRSCSSLPRPSCLILHGNRSSAAQTLLSHILTGVAGAAAHCKGRRAAPHGAHPADRC